MKFGRILLILLLITLIAAVITNPDEEKHKEAMKETMRNGLSKALQSNGIKEGNTFHNAITKDLYENYLWTSLIEKEVERKNYFVLSVSQVKYGGKEYTAGIGILGKVYIFPQVEKEVTNRINKLIKDGGGLKNVLK